MPNRGLRIAVGIIGVSGLLFFFLLQRFDFSAIFFGVSRPIAVFLINRSVRFLINDLFAIVLIYALFEQRKYVIFSIWVQLAGLVFLLLPYFVLKVYFPAYNGPLISFLHRIVLNPILLLLLIPAFYYQKRLQKE